MAQSKRLRRRSNSRPPPPALSESIGFLLNKAAQFMREQFESRLAIYGLSAPQVGILSVVVSTTASTQRSLGEVLRIDRTTMVRLIDRLEELGLIARKDNASDRRSYAVGITAKGEAVLRRALADAARTEGQILDRVSARDRQTLHRVLSAIPQRERDS